jgi:hypothetical protein
MKPIIFLSILLFTQPLFATLEKASLHFTNNSLVPLYLYPSQIYKCWVSSESENIISIPSEQTNTFVVSYTCEPKQQAYYEFNINHGNDHYIFNFKSSDKHVLMGVKHLTDRNTWFYCLERQADYHFTYGLNSEKFEVEGYEPIVDIENCR